MHAIFSSRFATHASILALPQLLLLCFSDAQQLPFTNVDKFDLSEDFRTNVCQRQFDIINGNRTLSEALAGLDLTVAMTNYASANEDKLFSLDPSTGGIKENNPGLFVLLMDEVAKRSGFRWRDSYAAISPLNSNDGNKTWTDLLKWEVTHFDIAADYWGRSRQRMALGVSFPKGWYDGSIILAQSRAINAKEDKFSSFWSFLLPFDLGVWLLIVTATIFTGMMYFVLERLNVESDERELENKPVTAIFLASLTFTGHFQFCPNTNAARLLSFSWTFWALIITSAYTANMASFLVTRNGKEASVATLEDALKRGTPVCIQRYSVMDEIVSKKYPDLNVVRKDSEQELFDSLRTKWHGGNGGCGAALTNLGTFSLYEGNRDVNYDCSLTSERRVVQTLPSGFATGVDTGTLCTSLISYVINIHMSEMISEGFVEKAWREHIAKIATIDCEAQEDGQVGNPEDENFSLKITEMAGIFMMHLALLVFAVLVAFFDLRSRLRKGRNQAS